MYQRFLNNSDYLGIITEEALDQLIRGREKRLLEAEEAAEQSIVEYLTINYEVEAELEVGKRLIGYSNQVTYPAGAHFIDPEGNIVQTLRTINGIKSPESSPCWEECEDEPEGEVQQYTQRHSYSPGDIVTFGTGHLFRCTGYNGPDFNNVRIPGIKAWERAEVGDWEANVDYAPWSVVRYKDAFFTLMVEKENRNLVLNPMASSDWGMIGEYSEDYTYELSDHEYVVYGGEVFYPVMDPNPDTPEIGVNTKCHDPRNPNLKKHLLRLALYELHKLISPANVSSARITDYETSIAWLRDASRLKLSPGIPRKLDKEKKPVADFATATYMRSYDPYQNIWHV